MNWLRRLFQRKGVTVVTGGLPPRTDMRQSPYPSLGVFALPGEVVYCENGHRIAEVTDLMMFGGGVNERFALKFDGCTPEPEIGAPMSQCLCKLCGGLWVMGGNLHFKDGWR